MTVAGTRAEWEEWTGMTFPDDGDYVVPGALVPVHFKNERGLYVEPNVWVRHAVLAATRYRAVRLRCFSMARRIWRFVASSGTAPC